MRGSSESRTRGDLVIVQECLREQWPKLNGECLCLCIEVELF